MASSAAALNETDANDAGNTEPDPRDERIKELEKQVRALKLRYEFKIGLGVVSCRFPSAPLFPSALL